MPAEFAISAESCNCFAVRSAARHVTQLYDQFLAPAGLRATQFSILAKLKRRGPLTMQILAKEMVMDRSTLARNIQPLERDGLIALSPSADDRRAKEVSLTRAGETRLAAGFKAWTKAQARFETGFGVKRSAELRGLLHDVVANEFSEDRARTAR
jgi:DNA-binding MarR family transcriptional regulator